MIATTVHESSARHIVVWAAVEHRQVELGTRAYAREDQVSTIMHYSQERTVDRRSQK